MKNKSRERGTHRSLAGSGGTMVSVLKKDPVSRQCRGEERRRRRQWCRMSTSVGAGVQMGDGGGFPSLSLGPAVKRKGQRGRGR
jgi:hypothetical protein